MMPRILSALIVAHPGHEIRLHGWLEQTRPLVLILTDGTGRDSPARIGAAARYLDSIDVPAGALFGRYTDQAIYEALLSRDFARFVALVDELAELLVHTQTGFVVGDAVEGYNSTHDVFRFVLDAAVAIAARKRGCTIAQYDFPIVRAPAHCPPEARAGAVWLDLSDEVLARKLAAARRYYPELVTEILTAFARTHDSPMRRFLDLNAQAGAANERRCLEQFRVECLRPVSAAASEPRAQPFYELQGERQRAAGHYRQVIRYREHIRPLAERLAAHAAAKIDEPAQSSNHQSCAR
jgi:hypothetical protein